MGTYETCMIWSIGAGMEGTELSPGVGWSSFPNLLSRARGMGKLTRVGMGGGGGASPGAGIVSFLSQVTCT